MSSFVLFIANVNVYRSIFGFQGTIAAKAFLQSELRGTHKPAAYFVTGILRMPSQVHFRRLRKVNFPHAGAHEPARSLQPLPPGGKGIRTPDPLLAGQVLSQLSYTPKNLAAACSPMPSPA